MSRSALFVILLLLAGCSDAKPAAPAPTPAEPVVSAFTQTVAKTRTGVTPIDVAVGEDGVWAANNAAGTVTRVDPASARRVGPEIRVGAAPVAIAAGAGSVWVARSTGFVVRIDPATNRRTGAAQPIADPGGIDALGDQVWVTSRTAGTVQRIDPGSGRVVGKPVRVGAGATDVAVGDGTIWVAASDTGTVTPVDSETGQAGDPIQVTQRGAPAGKVLALAYGEGGVWVATAGGPVGDELAVREIDPETRAVVGDPVPVEGGIPLHLAAGGGGVWVTEVGTALQQRPPGLQRIDPGTRKPAGAPIRLGAGPAGLAVGPDGVWVAESGDNTVRQIGSGD